MMKNSNINFSNRQNYCAKLSHCTFDYIDIDDILSLNHPIFSVCMISYTQSTHLIQNLRYY